MEVFTPPGSVTAFFEVVLINVVLSGDNAIAIGLAASGLPANLRDRAILFGLGAATLLRVAFAAVTTQLLSIVGLLLAGGLLLMWVCWKMWTELRTTAEEEQLAEEALAHTEHRADFGVELAMPHKTFAQAAWQIIVADVSMSLDNVLAVAGAAREYLVILAIGLALSIALMGIAASLLARVLQHHRWIAYLGLAVIVYVAAEMIYRGALELWPYAFALL